MGIYSIAQLIYALSNICLFSFWDNKKNTNIHKYTQRSSKSANLLIKFERNFIDLLLIIIYVCFLWKVLEIDFSQN